MKSSYLILLSSPVVIIHVHLLMIYWRAIVLRMPSMHLQTVRCRWHHIRTVVWLILQVQLLLLLLLEQVLLHGEIWEGFCRAMEAVDGGGMIPLIHRRGLLLLLLHLPLVEFKHTSSTLH